MSTYTDQILDAVDILVNEKVSTLQFDQTIRATIKEVVDASIGKYKVSYQNSLLYAYSLNIDNTYSVGTQVYIEIPSSDFNKDIIIVGPVSKLGINYVAVVAPEDRVGIIGNNLINNTDEIAFCSYKESQSHLISGISESEIYSLYKDKCDTLVLAANFKTALPIEQQIGGGNYGLKVKCTYVNSAYKTPDDNDIITREYIFNVDNMEGQPYKYTLGSRQVALFPIDGVNLKSIDSIEAFCENFPNIAEDKDNDIFISNIELYLGALYTEEELSGSSLRIIYPNGNIIGDKSSLELKANLRIKGKAVNVQEQGIGFYWFKKDGSVTSSSELYSPYGGVGWSCLNPNEDIDGKHLFYIDNESKIIEKSILTAYKNIFKCVAIYSDNGQEVILSAQGELYNTENQEVIIESSTGTNFSFNIGKTTLKCVYKKDENTVYSYYWTQKIDSGVEEPCSENGQEIDVNIGVAAHIAEYSCTVYENGINCGTGFIILVNESETKHGYTLIINNGTKIFKYDEYGVSPTSVSKAPSDRMVLETLTFDIYNELGQKIDFTDEEKIRVCNIKWVFPSENTLLTTAENLVDDNLINVTTNTSEKRKIAQNKTDFTYGIENWYNEWKKNNNIQLEVDYLDQHLVVSTNFTFTKEGELGTNGTKYIARIVPNNIDAIVIVGTIFYGIKFNNNIVSFTSKGTSPKITDLVTAQLWNGGIEPVSALVSWSIADTTKRAGTPRLTINENNVTINSSGNVNCNILQATFTYDGKKFYATYPIIYTTGTINDIPWLLNGYKEVMYESDGTRGKFDGLPFTVIEIKENEIKNASNETISTFPEDAGFKTQQLEETSNYSIEPPSYFISETAGHYISVTIDDKTTYFPIQLYLNRYGMAAMNDWDGTSIEINNDGSYILAPQIGAGTKNNDNQFTGITMGEVFQASNNKQIKQVGLFGYGDGEQTLFLDAQTGNATFGKSGNGQIKIKANGEGTIESGDYSTTNKKGLKINFSSNTVDSQQGPFIKYGSGDFEVDASGYITAKGGGSIAGWQIEGNNLLYGSNKKIYLDSSAPKIYGQKDSSKQHNTLTSSYEGFYLASDGLSIGSKFKATSTGIIRVGENATSANNNKTCWEINGATNNNVSRSYISYNSDTAVPSIIGSNTNLGGTDNSVYLGTDGIRLGKQFGVDNNGNAKLNNLYANGTGQIGGWNIGSTTLSTTNLKIDSGNEKIYSGEHDTLTSTKNGFYLSNSGLSIGSKFYAGSNSSSGVIRVGVNATTDGTNCWTISGDTNNNSYIKYGTKGSNNSVYLGTDEISLGKTFKVDNDGVLTSTSGKIGGWTIGANTLKSGNVTLNSTPVENDNNPQRINVNSKFIAYNDGSIKAIAGTIGGWNIGDHSLQAIKTSGGGSLTLTLKDDGSIVGPTVGGSTVWQIESNGVAHFKNVIIDNNDGNYGGSSLTWKNGNDTVFSVDPNGNLTAKLATLSGGTIGGISIYGDYIGQYGSWSISSSGMNFGNGMFYVDTSGNVTANALTASNANVSGTINASSGSFGGAFTASGGQVAITGGSLSYGDEVVTMRNIRIPSLVGMFPSGFARTTTIDLVTSATVTINGQPYTVTLNKTPKTVVESIADDIDGSTMVLGGWYSGYSAGSAYDLLAGPGVAYY